MWIMPEEITAGNSSRPTARTGGDPHSKRSRSRPSPSRCCSGTCANHWAMAPMSTPQASNVGIPVHPNASRIPMTDKLEINGLRAGKR
jgi:hypothetical protein